MGKFGHVGFAMEKKKRKHLILMKFLACNLKVGRCRQHIDLMKLHMWVFKVKVIS